MAEKKKKQQGHYCWRCGRRRANEKFSGIGHAKHICKDCVVEQRAELKRKRAIASAQRVATNLFEATGDERILQTSHVRIERIVLINDSTPDWSEHDYGKWLILLRGSAAIDFHGEIGLRQMCIGDYVFVPPQQKHRITTTSKLPTVWLAVFVREKKVATKCRVKKKRNVKKVKKAAKRAPGKPVTGQKKFNFGG